MEGEKKSRPSIKRKKSNKKVSCSVNLYSSILKKKSKRAQSILGGLKRCVSLSLIYAEYTIISTPVSAAFIVEIMRYGPDFQYNLASKMRLVLE